MSFLCFLFSGPGCLVAVAVAFVLTMWIDRGPESLVRLAMGLFLAAVFLGLALLGAAGAADACFIGKGIIT